METEELRFEIQKNGNGYGHLMIGSTEIATVYSDTLEFNPEVIAKIVRVFNDDITIQSSDLAEGKQLSYLSQQRDEAYTKEHEND